ARVRRVPAHLAWQRRFGADRGPSRPSRQSAANPSPRRTPRPGAAGPAATGSSRHPPRHPIRAARLPTTQLLPVLPRAGCRHLRRLRPQHQGEDLMTTTEPTIVETPGSGTQHVWPLPVDEATLLDLITTVFTDHWQHIHFGPIIEGAAWEVGAPGAPTAITLNDGYATVDFGAWHFHLCIGEHTASGPELGRIRRCSRAGRNSPTAPASPGPTHGTGCGPASSRCPPTRSTARARASSTAVDHSPTPRYAVPSRRHRRGPSLGDRAQAILFTARHSFSDALPASFIPSASRSAAGCRQGRAAQSHAPTERPSPAHRTRRPRPRHPERGDRPMYPDGHHRCAPTRTAAP